MKNRTAITTFILLSVLTVPAFPAVINGTTIAGNQLTITGTGLSGTPLTVTFNAIKLAVVRSSATEIIATLAPLPPAGTYRLLVKAGTVSVTSYVAISGIPNVVAQLALTGLTGPIPETLLFTPSAPGFYQISGFTSVVATTETSGSLQINVPELKSAFPGSATSVSAGGQTNVWRQDSPAPISYSIDFYNVAGGTINYEAFLTIQQLQ